MDQFALHDLFADEFAPTAHPTHTNPQPLSSGTVSSTYMPTDHHGIGLGGGGHQSDFGSFFNGGSTGDFLQTHNAFQPAAVTTTVSQLPLENCVQSTTTQKQTLFGDDLNPHMSYSAASNAVLLENQSQQLQPDMQQRHKIEHPNSEFDLGMKPDITQQQHNELSSEHNYTMHDNGHIKPEVKEEEGETKEDQAAVEMRNSELDNVIQMTTINNVVCAFNTRCHINLKRVATEGSNVIFKKENNMVNMKLRKPKTTASIWSSGKITCTGCESEAQAHTASRRIARQLQKLGFKVRFANYKVVNVLGTCFFPFAISLNSFSAAHRQLASYEPELHPGVTYKLKEPRATLKIFSTGSITVTAPSEANIHAALRHIFPLVLPFQLAKEKLNPREYELTVKYLASSTTSASKKAGVMEKYQHFRYVKRAEEEDSYDDESSYGEDSDSN